VTGVSDMGSWRIEDHDLHLSNHDPKDVWIHPEISLKGKVSPSGIWPRARTTLYLIHGLRCTDIEISTQLYRIPG
jgi:hypothetical protein